MELSQQLRGKAAVITGSTQGLGEATARLFAERGAAGIVICGRKEIIDFDQFVLGSYHTIPQPARATGQARES
jgi:NAD(P)-dependent dehydrogenase (short-subunit alcohol dehydrogenase family)